MAKLIKAIADQLALVFCMCTYSTTKICVMAGTCFFFFLGKQCQQAVAIEAEGSEETMQAGKIKTDGLFSFLILYILNLCVCGIL